MNWDEVRQAYPNQWLVVEALEAHTTPDRRRHLDKLAVVEICADGKDALAGYRKYHREYPQREFYYVHSSRETLEIREQNWVGIRHTYAA